MRVCTPSGGNAPLFLASLFCASCPVGKVPSPSAVAVAVSIAVNAVAVKAGAALACFTDVPADDTAISSCKRTVEPYYILCNAVDTIVWRRKSRRRFPR